jgi:hypothetical protein
MKLSEVLNELIVFSFWMKHLEKYSTIVNIFSLEYSL